MTIAASRLGAALRRMSEGRVVSLELVHRVLDGAPHVIHACPLPKMGGGYLPLAGELMDVAQEYADDVQARCEIAVHGLAKGGQCIASKAWRQESADVKPETDLSGSDLVPTGPGITSQMMAHTERLHRLLTGSLNSLLVHHREELAAARGRVAELESREREQHRKAVGEDAADSEQRHEALGKAIAVLSPIATAVAEVVAERMAPKPGGGGVH